MRVLEYFNSYTKEHIFIRILSLETSAQPNALGQKNNSTPKHTFAQKIRIPQLDHSLNILHKSRKLTLL